MRIFEVLRENKDARLRLARTARTRSEAQPEVSTYRRNRTMTDRSTLPEVSERVRIHQLRMLRRKIGIGIFIVLICVLLGVIGIGQYTGSVRLVNRDASLTRPIDDEAYRKLFDDYYQHHPVERFRFATNYERLSVALQRDATEIAMVKPAGTDSLSVSRYELIMRKPVASWTVEDRKYYVDAKGVTFTRNYYAEPAVSVTDNSGASIVKGSAIASSRLLSFVGRVIAISSEQAIRVTSIEIPAGSTRQLYIKGEGMPTVRMAVDREADVQVHDMAATLRYLKQMQKDVEYIDVRVEGKAFYR